MAHYEYDAWGNVLSVTDQNGNAITSATHIGNLNPFRYRGYYLDTETGLYYLMSRYYDPVVHRFINADGYFQSGGSILDANMSAYCRNNLVNLFDSNGCAPKTMYQLQKELTEKENLSYHITAITAAQKQGYSMSDTFIVSNGKLVPYNLENQILDTIGSFSQSFEIRFGAGYGLGISEEICGVEITLFAKCDLVSLLMSSAEGFDLGAYCDIGFSIFTDQFGWDNEYYKSYLDESKNFSTDSGTDPNKFEVFSAGGYLIAGGGVSVLFNIDYMIKRLEEIWW